ncbi:hypothetical protein BH09ACT9_BH09ACT9_00350 [soil metagenome]
MSYLVCVTNDIPMRPCTIRGEHLDNCNGFVIRTDYQTGIVVQTDRVCNGCLPYPAERGYLCGSCAEKFDAALTVAVDLITHLRSTEQGAKDQTGTRSAPGSRVIVPASWMDADNLWCALWACADAFATDWGADGPERDVAASPSVGFNPLASIVAVRNVTEDLVAYVQAVVPNLIGKVDGAIAAVRFVAAVQTAKARYQFDIEPQKVHFIRCRSCQQMTLNRKPPLDYLDPIVIECSNDSCKALWDPRLVDFDLKLLRTEVQQAVEDRARRERIAARDRVRAESKARIKAAKVAEKAAQLAAQQVS